LAKRRETSGHNGEESFTNAYEDTEGQASWKKKMPDEVKTLRTELSKRFRPGRIGRYTKGELQL